LFRESKNSVPILQTALYFKIIICRTLKYQVLFMMAALMCISVSCQAQSARQYINYGDEAMRKGEHYNAAQYYKQGLDKFEFNLELEFKYAEALRGYNDYKNAAEAYKKVVQDDVTHVYPLSTFWYGTMQHYLGRYESAIAQFKKFRNKYTEKGYYRDKAQQEIESCEWANVNQKDSVSLKIEHLPDGEVNTAYSETNPLEDSHGHLLFSSLRDQSSNKRKPKFLARIYQSDSLFKTAKVLPIPDADQSKHIANGAFSTDMKRFYFTVCEPVEDNQSLLRCDIYISHVNHDSIYDTQKLDDNVNYKGATSTEPNIGINEKGEEILYFVSDRPGGYGKTDIWMSKIINDSSYEISVNLGTQINSQDEEFSPFYDSHDQKLYFASNWQYGFGGLDIFQSQYTHGAWSIPKNLGRSVNSPQNDFYFYKSRDRSKNYFASNRKGSVYIKSETCCNDIWMYETGTKIDVSPIVDTPETKTMTEARTDTSNKAIAGKVKADTPVVSLPISVAIHADAGQRVFIDKTVTKIRQLLPVTLYFHNDEPECCNLRDTTSLNYIYTYQQYWRLLDTYKKEFDKGLSADQKTKADREVFNLFTDKVGKGYHELIQFSAQLLDLLQSGQKIEITIQGYCSPLNYSEYNIQLGYRRITSLRNYFYHYRTGILMPYINSGKLILKNESLGKERAAKNVSDNREDIRNSIYNPDAAIERKVEIISVEIK
jgi:tetratricopeptide (TPR) repeat protein